MTRSPLDDLIGVEREHPLEPSPADVREGWNRLARDISLGVAAPFDLPPPATAVTMAKSGLFSGTLAKLAVATLLVGGTVTAVVVSDANDRAIPVEPSPVGRLDAPSIAIEPSEIAIEPTAIEPPLAEVSSPRPAAARAASRPRSRAQKREPAAPAEGIAAELGLIDRARRAVAAAQFDAAFDILDEHTERFPTGALLEDRAALRVIASCRSGRAKDGAAERDRFLARWPQSVHGETVSRACNATNDTSRGG